jgi:hypothetical protein
MLCKQQHCCTSTCLLAALLVRQQLLAAVVGNYTHLIPLRPQLITLCLCFQQQCCQFM